jgi:hypothetical protein
MKTMNQQAPADPPSPPPDLSDPFPIQAVSWVVPGAALLLLLTTGLIWAAIVWST